MPRPYDDERYLEWCSEVSKLIFEYLDTEGNNEDTLEDEIGNAIENAQDA